jgi:hypothetical protein
VSNSLLRFVPLGLLLLTACGSDDDGAVAADKGTISVRAYGESFIEDGIPAEDVDDGWSITFDRFEVRVRNLRVAGVRLDDPAVVDLAVESSGEGHELASAEVSAGAHREPSFSIDHVEVEGSAERDGTVKSFHWTFAEPTHYSHCETSTTVEPNGHATFQITVHADHLFYDSLVAEEPQLLFDAIAAADEDDDGAVTRTELEARDIGDYDPGNEDADDLWSWLVAQHRTLGHVDGEGHCEATPEN